MSSGPLTRRLITVQKSFLTEWTTNWVTSYSTGWSTNWSTTWDESVYGNTTTAYYTTWGTVGNYEYVPYAQNTNCVPVSAPASRNTAAGGTTNTCAAAGTCYEFNRDNVFNGTCPGVSYPAGGAPAGWCGYSVTQTCGPSINCGFCSTNNCGNYEINYSTPQTVPIENATSWTTNYQSCQYTSWTEYQYVENYYSQYTSRSTQTTISVSYPSRNTSISTSRTTGPSTSYLTSVMTF